MDVRDGKRSDGITTSFLPESLEVCLDGACADTFSECRLKDSVTAAGSATHEANTPNYQKLCDPARRFQFRQLTIETKRTNGEEIANIIQTMEMR